uniref:Thymidine kinase n=1 Tax=Phallusia mammillata TaxID=59560 RepID=A0A6F9DVH6_9ASCI|nr:thymidine kinase, cytosolic-like [Phallusia mammillata]
MARAKVVGLFSWSLGWRSSDQNLKKTFAEIYKMSCVSLSGFTHSPTKDRGQIQVIFGPMFSGKSTELMRRIRRYQIANRDCLVIKYAKDFRYSEEGMATHDKQVIPAVKATKLMTLKNVHNFSVIGIDEGQFFSDIVTFCEEMANSGKTVIVAALDGTFERKAFGSILDLVPIAESVVKLNAVCTSCFREAAFTKRLGQEKEIEVIGGTDKYMATCRQCFSPSLQLALSPKKPIQPGRSPLAVINSNQVISAPNKPDRPSTGFAAKHRVF